jgi:fluoroquinolone resistance protein
MSTALPEPSAPDGAATAAQVAAQVAALAGAGPARLIGWNLSDVELDDLDLREWEFVRCRGARARFSSCDLSEARFVASDFNNAVWRWGSLAQAGFSDCKLTGAQVLDTRAFELSFERCLLISARLRELSFRSMRIEGVDFEGADLSGADFREAVLVDCNLAQAHVIDARFEGADLRGANLGGLKLADASRFKGAVISKTQAGALLSALGLKVA